MLLRAEILSLEYSPFRRDRPPTPQGPELPASQVSFTGQAWSSGVPAVVLGAVFQAAVAGSPGKVAVVTRRSVSLLFGRSREATPPSVGLDSFSVFVIWGEELFLSTHLGWKQPERGESWAGHPAGVSPAGRWSKITHRPRRHASPGYNHGSVVVNAKQLARRGLR